MKELTEKAYQTDVLVIGAGGAGLRAAIEAHNAGADVLIVSKGDYPNGCVTAVAMGAMSARLGKSDSADRHYEDTIKGGYQLNNPKLVRLLVDNAADRAKDIERYGTEFEKKDNEYDLFLYTGNSVPRAVQSGDQYRGGFFRGLVKEAGRLGLQIIQHVMVTDLLQQQGAVKGAVALNLDTKEIMVIKAKAVIMATGGAGSLYSLTTNPAGITGDGYALAFNAGAKLMDMEFVQTRAAMIVPAAMRGTPPPGDGLVTEGGRFYNGLLERYMRKYHPEKAENVTRSEISLCTQKEIMEGRNSPNGGVYGDFSGVSDKDLNRFKAFVQSCHDCNYDPSYQPYEWAPGAHYFIGGIVIDEACRTSIPGLLAAGEVESGVMGANRLGGNALAETQVFGAIAGATAASMATAEGIPEIDQQEISRAKEHIRLILSRTSGMDYREVNKTLSELMSRYAGVLRNESGLRTALEAMEDIRRDKIDRICLSGAVTPQDLAGIFETENILTIGRIILKAALMRTESRGAHNREEYPQMDDNWLKNIIFEKRDGEAVASIMPIPGA